MSYFEPRHYKRDFYLPIFELVWMSAHDINELIDMPMLLTRSKIRKLVREEVPYWSGDENSTESVEGDVYTKAINNALDAKTSLLLLGGWIEKRDRRGSVYEPSAMSYGLGLSECLSRIKVAMRNEIIISDDETADEAVERIARYELFGFVDNGDDITDAMIFDRKSAILSGLAVLTPDERYRYDVIMGVGSMLCSLGMRVDTDHSKSIFNHGGDAIHPDLLHIIDRGMNRSKGRNDVKRLSWCDQEIHLCDMKHWHERLTAAVIDNEQFEICLDRLMGVY